MTFVTFCFDIMNGVLSECAGCEPWSQLQKKQAEPLVLKQQVEKPMKTSMAAKPSLQGGLFPQ